MTKLDDTTTAGEWRAVVTYCRDMGIPMDRDIELALIFADFLKVADDAPLIPSVCAAVAPKH